MNYTSWYNVSRAYNNITVKHTHDKEATWTKINYFSDSNNPYSDPNAVIQLNWSWNKLAIKLQFIPPIYSIGWIKGGYRLNLRNGEFGDLNNKKRVTNITYSDKLPCITKGIDTLLVHIYGSHK